MMLECMAINPLKFFQDYNFYKIFLHTRFQYTFQHQQQIIRAEIAVLSHMLLSNYMISGWHITHWFPPILLIKKYSIF